jgi:hypothetical protein
MSKPDQEITSLTLYKVHEFYNDIDQETRNHLFYMLDEIPQMTDTRKINRWLGFIHGTLVALTDCTIDELKEVCRDRNKQTRSNTIT